MAKRIITLILLLCSHSVFATTGLFGISTQPRFLPADQAFAFSHQQQDSQLILSWQISPGYYLYRQQIEVSGENATLLPAQLPAGLPHNDEFFGETEIYRDKLVLPVTINAAQQGATINISWQGCAEEGFCYPPQSAQISLNAITPVVTSGTVTTNTTLPDTTTANHTDQDTSLSATVADNGKQGHLPFNPLWALLIGIGVAFTPCVLPMYPLISAVVLGGEQRLSSARSLWLAFIYVQGMALTYTVLGIIVALAGLQFQAAFQSPYILIGLSLLFTLLALSMFGLFTLQLPSALQTRIAALSHRQQGGSTGGVFIMGAIAGLICSPCTTAPLSAILLYIAQSGNLLQGGGTLYLYAFGMGLPLILVAVFGNRLLPKSGPWMEQVKTGFGFVILALPIFLLERVVGETVALRLWALLGVTFFAWGFITSLQIHRRWIRLIQIICLAATLISVRPLQDWFFGTAGTVRVAQLNFSQIHTSEQLSQALAQSKGNPVMLDLYADWCVACKEFEKYTFSDPQVQQALANTVLLKIDMTETSASNTELLKRLNVPGLPTILFFDPQGKEQQRVTGFMNATRFLAHLQKLKNT